MLMCTFTCTCAHANVCMFPHVRTHPCLQHKHVHKCACSYVHIYTLAVCMYIYRHTNMHAQMLARASPPAPTSMLM